MTQQLVRVDLTTQGLGMVTLDVPKLVLNQPIPDSLFTFVPPAGVKVLPLQAANAIPRQAHQVGTDQRGRIAHQVADENVGNTVCIAGH